MTQRAKLSSKDQGRLEEAMAWAQSARIDLEKSRQVVVEMIDKSSYREVARLTGLSTNTLQRWKREANG